MKAKNKPLIKIIIFIILISLIIYLVSHFNIKNHLTPESIKTMVLSFGTLAPLGFILIYNIGSILFLPGSILSVAGGIIFGKLLGTIYVIIGATIGATLAFLISRYFARSFFEDIVERKYPRIKEYDQGIKENGFKAVLALRLIPIFPFNGLNFALGLTSVKIKDYFLATLIGIIPGTFVYVYLGNSLVEMNLTNIITAIVLIIVLSFVLKIAKRKEKK